MELTNAVYESIRKYFSSLSHMGYVSYTEVYKLLAMIFIEEILYGPLSVYVTERDYVTISNSLDCLYGSCMIPYPSYKKSASSILNNMNYSYRLTEDDIFRTEYNYLRVDS